MKERYFLIMYIGYSVMGADARFGQGTAITKKGQYINCKKASKAICKQHNLVRISITNIIELNKKDFEEFKRIN